MFSSSHPLSTVLVKCGRAAANSIVKLYKVLAWIQASCPLYWQEDRIVLWLFKAQLNYPVNLLGKKWMRQFRRGRTGQRRGVSY